MPDLAYARADRPRGTDSRELDLHGVGFVNERERPLTASAVHKIIARAARQAKPCFPVHPHMLQFRIILENRRPTV
jgi:site-specific recombinase XerD